MEFINIIDVPENNDNNNNLKELTWKMELEGVANS